jgi:hypothetical protein
MDDTFTFVAPVTARRQVDPFALRLAIGMTVLTLVAGSFSVFLVAHEHAADVRRAARETQVARAATSAPLGDAEMVSASGIVDAEARSSLERALTLAQAVRREDGSFAGADPVALQTLQPSLVFVDGPSTAPRIVSVAADPDGWAAAAMGASGTCYWVRRAAGASVVHGAGDVCTGTAALLESPASA